MLLIFTKRQVAAIVILSLIHIWFPPERQAGRPLLLVAWSRDALAAPHLERQVERLEDIHEGTLMHDGRLIRHYYYRVALGYRGAPTAARVR